MAYPGYEETVIINNQQPTVTVLTSASGPVAGPQGTQGIQGVQGDQGYSILSGLGAPNAALGRNGDFYIDQTVSAPVLYGPKTAGAWGSGAPLRGPQGVKGDKGDTGLTGATGAAGTVTFAGTGSAATAARSDHFHTDEGTTDQFPLVGPARTAGAQLYRKTGTFVGTVANANGDVNFSFAQAFPNGIFSIVMNPGDAFSSAGGGNGRLIATVPWLPSFTKSGGIVCVYHQYPEFSGAITGVPAGRSVRIAYTAMGW